MPLAEGIPVEQPSAPFPADVQWLLRAVAPGNQALTAPQASIDIEKLIRLAEVHGLLPLLASRAGPWFPEEHSIRLTTALRTNAARNLWLRGCADDVVGRLRAAAISAIPFKGPALAETLYGNVGLRSCLDVDILVRRSQIRDARDVLFAAGYLRAEQLSAAQEQLTLAHNSELQILSPNGVLVELQWRLLPRYFAVVLTEAELWRGAVEGDRPALSPTMLFLALLINGGKERWAKLISVLDLAQFIHRYPAFDWHKIREFAVGHGLRRWLEVGCLLARRLFAVELPPALHPGGADPVRDLLVEEFCRDLAHGGVALPDGQLHRFLLRLRERPADRARYALRLVTTPGAGEWKWIELPAALYPLYYVLRPIRFAGKMLASLFARQGSAAG